MTAELQRRAQELESQAAAIRGELDGIYAELTEGDDDSFMYRMETTWEARFNAVVSRFHEMRSVIAAILNNPTSPRDQVQSSLLLLNEKVRDFTP